MLGSRYLTVSQGNLNNHHLYLAKILDLFPEDFWAVRTPDKPLAIACAFTATRSHRDRH